MAGEAAKGHKPAVMAWTPEHWEARYIAAFAVGASAPTPLWGACAPHAPSKGGIYLSGAKALG